MTIRQLREMLNRIDTEADELLVVTELFGVCQPLQTPEICVVRVGRKDGQERRVLLLLCD